MMPTLGMLVVDECPDALGHHTIREADGTANGNTDTCIATVYDEEAAQIIVRACNSYAALVAFVEEFDKWQATGDGIADDEGGFSDVEAARNAVPIE
jgi:hypothetical protein